MNNQQKIVKHTLRLTLFTLIIALSSCGSNKQALYNPIEVEHLSKKLGVVIHNDDPNIPLYAESSLWIGVPYRYAGNTKRGIDCSGFSTQIYKLVYGKSLERSSNDQYRKDVKKIGIKKLKPGDLVFFRTSRKSKKIDHVGVYLKDGYFVHASNSKGVIVSNLNENYYKKIWKKGGRVK